MSKTLAAAGEELEKALEPFKVEFRKIGEFGVRITHKLIHAIGSIAFRIYRWSGYQPPKVTINYSVDFDSFNDGMNKTMAALRKINDVSRSKKAMVARGLDVSSPR